jgi:hypothetical protein
MLSQAGSLQLEFQYLSDISGNPIYAKKVLNVNQRRLRHMIQ